MTDSFLTISEINFLAGESDGQPGTVVNPSPVTIFVGPNNSGKSTALREIQQLYAGSPTNHEDHKLVRSIELTEPADWDTLFGTMAPWRIESPHLFSQSNASVGSHTFNDSDLVFGADSGNIVGISQSEIQAHEPYIFPSKLREVRRILLLHLDGRNRFRLTEPASIQGGYGQSFTIHSKLYYDASLKDRISQRIHDAFGYYLEVDATNHSQFLFRVSRQALPSELVQKINLEAELAFSSMPKIQETGDGIQAFTGIIAATNALPYKLILIDEPEAFLHPPLARRLGRELTETVTNNRTSLVIATHSADVLMGCVEQSLDVTIIRLTFDQGVATVSTLRPTDIKDLMQDPILRSANVLDALFHRCAVVVEAAADRAFYEECNRRLRRNGRGVEDCLFLTSTGRDDSHRIVRALRKTRLPVAALLDFDTLGSKSFKRILESCCSNQSVLDSLMRKREQLFTLIKPMPDEVKKNGMSAFDGPDALRVRQLVDDLSAHGFFLVPNGALESWLSELTVPRGPDAKSSWLSRIFEKMGTTTDDPNYMNPGGGDIWAFLDQIETWVAQCNSTMRRSTVDADHSPFESS